MKKLNYFVIFFILFCFNSRAMYICTCADEMFFSRLLNFIGSAHKVSFNEIEQIAVFNLGLNAEQVETLNKIQKVSVYDIELVNPDMLKYVDTGRPDKRLIRGWYSWKPVVIKQALDMFPHVLYSDAGSVFTSDISSFYNNIKKKGYSFVTCVWSIGRMAPKNVVEKFKLNLPERKWILNVNGLAGTLIGLTRAHYNNFVLPMYDLAHDIKNFIDDGTTPGGFGEARHDQVLFSIIARLNSLDVADSVPGMFRFWAMEENWNELKKYIRYKK